MSQERIELKKQGNRTYFRKKAGSTAWSRWTRLLDTNTLDGFRLVKKIAFWGGSNERYSEEYRPVYLETGLPQDPQPSSSKVHKERINKGAWVSTAAFSRNDSDADFILEFYSTYSSPKLGGLGLADNSLCTKTEEEIEALSPLPLFGGKDSAVIAKAQDSDLSITGSAVYNFSNQTGELEFQLFVPAGKKATVDWGDGKGPISYTALEEVFQNYIGNLVSGIEATHTYTGTGSRTVTISSRDVTRILLPTTGGTKAALTSATVNKLGSITNAESMFYNCQFLTSLDVSGFDTSKVTNMSYMFYNCRGLTSLDVSSFDTSSVTAMNGMFNNCRALTSVTFGASFDTSSVTDMEFMFTSCYALTSVTFGASFDTSSVTDISGMFSHCYALTSLDLSNFDTSSVTTMAAMFYNCEDLNSLTFGASFDTSNVTAMGSMFRGCTDLETLNLSSWCVANLSEPFWFGHNAPFYTTTSNRPDWGATC